ncbi:MAG: hypothetical protein J0I21_00750, partial [Alphaproteobacteria bacterium]|nr:hypothetical protein [Alphaproteobacteria bacterium]
QTQEAKASFMMRSKTAAALAAAGLLAIHPAAAHVIAGVRVFPVTLTFDDPGTADEVTLPQFVWQRDSGPENVYQWQWEWDKTITPNTAIIYNQGYDMLQAAGEKTRTGFENAVLTGKWQAYTNAEHEFVVSLGVSYEFNGGYATQNVDGDAYGGVSPTIYAGKGLGDLPIGVLRPLAITGELSYNIATRRLNSTLDNNGAPNSWEGGFSVQYSIPYLQSQVKDYGLPRFINHLIPLVETTWWSPAQAPATGFPMTLTVAPGVIYMADDFQVGVEALIPANRAAGHNVGVIAQLHFFLDDIFPHTLGAPLLK